MLGIADLFDTTGFPPRWHCGDWSDTLGWVHVISDLAVWSAYTAIPCVLIYFTFRRRDLPFLSIFWLFGAFILACGTVHLIEAIIFWQPVYRLSGAVKLITAIVSWGTVLALIPIAPKALALRSPRELEEEIRERRRVEAELTSLNLTLERRVEERTLSAEKANRTKSEFLANISHELRTPLGAILGFADMLLDPAVKPEVRAAAAHRIRSNGGHLLQLINDILDLSKVEAGKLELQCRPCSPFNMVRETISLLSGQATEKNLKVEIQLAGLIPATIPSDPTRLRQILMNLVNNAIKFSDEGPIVVRMQIADSVDPHRVWLEFAITDRGPGIAREEMQRIFLPFQQADNSITRRRGGSGLGLSICRQLTDAMGGTISVTSEKGRGSTFAVRLPIPRPQPIDLRDKEELLATAPDIESGTSEESPLRFVGRVLLVEDGKENQQVIAYYLTRLGLEVELADNGRQGVDLATTQAFDLVFMDIQMPVLDGYSAASMLRARGYVGPIVALTAHAMRGDRERCLRNGCSDYLAKPVVAEDLVHILKAHLPPPTSPLTTPDPSEPKLVSVTAPPRGAPVPQPPPERSLRSLFADDDRFMQLVKAYVATLPKTWKQLQQAIEPWDAGTLERTVHDLKGSAGMYGYTELTETAKLFLTALQEGEDQSLLKELLAEIGSQIERILAKEVTQ